MHYPPPPWELYGQAHCHVLAVRASSLAATPAGLKPLVLAGHGLVIAGWVDYRAPSPLIYGELFAAVVGFAGRRPTASVTHMWVDSEPSMRGGRELWGYPKELACFSGLRACSDEGELARGTFRALVTAPLRIRLRTGTFQPGHGLVRAIVRGRPQLGRGRLEPGDRLAFLRGATRLATVGLTDFHCTFGV